jgi:hypothetical protein
MMRFLFTFAGRSPVKIKKREGPRPASVFDVGLQRSLLHKRAQNFADIVFGRRDLSVSSARIDINGRSRDQLGRPIDGAIRENAAEELDIEPSTSG